MVTHTFKIFHSGIFEELHLRKQESIDLGTQVCPSDYPDLDIVPLNNMLSLRQAGVKQNLTCLIHNHQEHPFHNHQEHSACNHQEHSTHNYQEFDER